jgi:hypothetical protein
MIWGLNKIISFFLPLLPSFVFYLCSMPSFAFAKAKGKGKSKKTKKKTSGPEKKSLDFCFWPLACARGKSSWSFLNLKFDP